MNELICPKCLKRKREKRSHNNSYRPTCFRCRRPDKLSTN